MIQAIAHRTPEASGEIGIALSSLLIATLAVVAFVIWGFVCLYRSLRNRKRRREEDATSSDNGS